jgi:septal ring factor EnvC (AmiA/AmiB activator)
VLLVAAWCVLLTQVQADLAHMQLTHSSERAHATAQQQQLATQQQQLECSLSDAQAARADAEARVREAEAKLCDMRAALDSQERLLRVLREQVAEGGIAAARAGDLEAAVQVGWHEAAG